MQRGKYVTIAQETPSKTKWHVFMADGVDGHWTENNISDWTAQCVIHWRNEV